MITQTYTRELLVEAERKPLLTRLGRLFRREPLTQEQLLKLFEAQQMRLENEQARHSALLNLTAGRPF